MTLWKMDTFFLEFILWIMEQSVRHGIKKLYFFTREGEFFCRIYHVVEKYGLCGDGRLETGGMECCRSRVPGAEILEVSRMSTFMPSLREICVSEMMRIWNLYPDQSVGALFQSLQVKDGRLWTYLEKYGIDADRTIHHPWKNAGIQALFQDQGFIKCMEAERDRQRAQLYAYLTAKGWGKEGTDTVGIVDIGWKGTIQDNLCRLYPERKIAGFYVGLQPFVSPQPANSKKYGFLDDFARRKSVLLTVRPLEMLCNSPNGSVAGYECRDEDGRMRFVQKNTLNLDIKSYAAQEADMSRKMQDLAENQCMDRGCSVYAVRKNDPAEDRVYYEYAAVEQKRILAKIHARCRGPKTAALRESKKGSGAAYKKKAQREVYRFIAYPDRKTVKAYFSLKHNEEFGIGSYVEVKAGKLRADILLQAVFSGSGRKKFKEVLKASAWPQGYLVQYWLYIFLAPYNFLLCRYLENKNKNQKSYITTH